MQKRYLSIVILNDADPHCEYLFTYKNMTLEQAIGFYRIENRKATGVVMVHENGAFSCLGRLTDVELQIRGA